MRKFKDTRALYKLNVLRLLHLTSFMQTTINLREFYKLKKRGKFLRLSAFSLDKNLIISLRSDLIGFLLKIGRRCAVFCLLSHLMTNKFNWSRFFRVTPFRSNMWIHFGLDHFNLTYGLITATSLTRCRFYLCCQRSSSPGVLVTLFTKGARP